MEKKQILSGTDVARMAANSAPEARAETAGRIAAAHSAGFLGARERGLAEDIFRQLLSDAAVSVRHALADGLKDSREVPADIVRTLASDIDDVALPVIRDSPLLSDGDLLEIVASGSEQRQTAVAQRPAVSEIVSAALAETERPKVVAALMSNNGARIAEATFARVLDRMSGHGDVNAAMARRNELPVSAIERLIHVVSEDMRQILITRHETSIDDAADLVLETRERATLALLGPELERDELEKLIVQLDAHGRLTPTLLLRALCLGEMRFFELAIAHRARVPLMNAYRLIHDEGRRGLLALCQRAGMPERLVPLVSAAVEIIDQSAGSFDEDPARLRARVAERVLTHSDEAFEGQPIDYIITRLGRGA